ncbi:SDR family oxidoreductase [Actinomadura fibrosa]|uniref:SDR family oxidoreductase n=1 Tax=Actinomadura fibrosa TaxID=111802 RepID=A0ABW2XES2_9ACTN|nr:SDR family oxidoreductase [Actinomadura fibrosa]
MTTRIALITGANKGIGFEAARLLGASGGTVVLLGARNPGLGRAAAATLAGEGIDARFVHLDVTDPATVEAAAKLIEAEHGRLDVLINNAATTATDASELDALQPSRTPAGLLREAFETNVFGVVTVTNAMLPLLRRSPAGRIVNVSSELGSPRRIGDPSEPFYRVNHLPYNVSKTALNGLTVAYAKELADGPIKVNAVTPGFCATDMNGHTGHLTPAQGAAVLARAASIGADGPTGVFLSEAGPEPW